MHRITFSINQRRAKFTGRGRHGHGQGVGFCASGGAFWLGSCGYFVCCALQGRCGRGYPVAGTSPEQMLLVCLLLVLQFAFLTLSRCDSFVLPAGPWHCCAAPWTFFAVSPSPSPSPAPHQGPAANPSWLHKFLCCALAKKPLAARRLDLLPLSPCFLLFWL